jgi:phage/plasmid-associated DNA primase
VLETEKISGLDDPEWWEKSGELPGILLWALAGLKVFRATGKFIEPQVCIDAKEEQRTDQSTSREFLKDNVIANTLFDIDCKDLYDAFKEWFSEGHKIQYIPNVKDFNKEVVRLFHKEWESGDLTRKQRGINLGRKRFWAGIGLRKNSEDAEMF